MLTTAEIRQFLQEDENSELKQNAKEGQRYYDGLHDILDYRMFYWNTDGNLVEDNMSSNAKIPHAFFTELVDQAVQFVLADANDLIKSDDTALQAHLDKYFNKNRKFRAELKEAVTGMHAKGFDYMFCYQGKDDRLEFEHADCIGVVEVEGRFADDGKDQCIYKYLDRVDKEGKMQWKIQVVDDANTYYYTQADDGEIVVDEDAKLNPKPHKLYTKAGEDTLYVKADDEQMFVPFFRLDNNKKKRGHLPTVKNLIDDYDIHASSLTNNLIDFDTPLHVVKGYPGEDLSKLQQNLKTRKVVATDEDGGVEVHTVAIPYEAREAKLELDEKGIYKFGMGLNLAGLKDSAATTNVMIEAAYALLKLRCGKIATQVEDFIFRILDPVLAEINEANETAYTPELVYCNFNDKVMSNAQENAQVELTEAQRKQTEINTLMSLSTHLDNETLMQMICEQLDIEYEEIKDKLPNPDEAVEDLDAALDGIDPAGGGVIE